MTMAVRVANGGYMLYSSSASRRFRSALTDPEGAQVAALRRILGRNAGSEFGRAHGFGGIATVDEYRARVAPQSYDDIAPHVERIASGGRGVLTAETIRCVEPTSGSAGPSKLIPYTAGLLAEFSAATMPWIHDLLRHRPAMRGGRSYWSVSPPARRPSATAGGIPIGVEHDSDYFPPFVRRLLDRLLATPRALSRAPDVASCRYLTLRALLAVQDLTFISVWNPSFLTLMASALDAWWPRLLADLATGELSIDLDAGLRLALQAALPADPRRASHLRRRFGGRAPTDLGEVWEDLSMISCWADAQACRALPPLRARFPDIEIQGKGLLATEGVVSIPWCGAGGSVAALTSHFLEFVPVDGGDARGAHELETDRDYEVLLTTSGGLYRYRLMDVVRVDGWYRRAPILSFRGRSDRTSDMAGEKLSPGFADLVLTQAADDAGVATPFAMLAPRWSDTPAYVLLVELDVESADRYATAVERRLGQSHHYALCRSLGQLGPVRAVAVADGLATHERVCLARGQRAGTIKPASLDTGGEWERVFNGTAPEVVA